MQTKISTLQNTKIRAKISTLATLLNQAFDALAPSDLALTVLSDTSIKLDWTNNSTNADGVSIERSTDGTNYSEVDTVTAVTSTYTDTTGADGTRYYYRLKSYKGAQKSDASTAANDYTWLKALISAIGTGVDVSTLQLIVSENQTITLDGAGRFYTDAAGTVGESTSWNVTTGARRTIYIKCPSGTANMIIPKPQKITSAGGGQEFWQGTSNSQRLTINIGKLVNITYLRHYFGGYVTFSGNMPETLTYFSVNGETAQYSYTGTMPPNMGEFGISGNANITITGALPSTLYYMFINSLTFSWTYTGALPASLTTFQLVTAPYVYWTYDGALPISIRDLSINGSNINWTYNQILGTANIGSFGLSNYRISKMSSADMVIMLDSLRTKTGTLPATITINDYADYASPPQTVVDAVAALKLAKSITTVNLGA